MRDDIFQAHIKPSMVARRGSSFILIGRYGCVMGVKAAQFRSAPTIVANKVRVIIGVKKRWSSSWASLKGSCIFGDQSVIVIKRIEYAAVMSVARKKRRNRSEFSGL